MARGQAVEAKSDKPDQQQFVVGDWYQLSLKRDDLKVTDSRGPLLDGQGILLKVTDDWVVLGYVLCEGRDTGVPLLRKLPYVGTWFGESYYQESKCYTWIPRNLVQVDKHESLECAVRDLVHVDEHESLECAALYRKVFAGDVPAIGKDCAVHFVKDYSRTRLDGDYVGIKDGQVVLTDTVAETKQMPDPNWGGLPFIGSYFTEEHVVVHTVEKIVPLKDVLLIANLVKSTPAEMQLMREASKFESKQ